MVGFLGFFLTYIASLMEVDFADKLGHLVTVSGLLSVISVYMMNKYRWINEEGSFCSGDFADDATSAPLYYKGLFIKSYLYFFWIVITMFVIVAGTICASSF